jgi:hypothetical protein
MALSIKKGIYQVLLGSPGFSDEDLFAMKNSYRAEDIDFKKNLLQFCYFTSELILLQLLRIFKNEIQSL